MRNANNNTQNDQNGLNADNQVLRTKAEIRNDYKMNKIIESKKLVLKLDTFLILFVAASVTLLTLTF